MPARLVVFGKILDCESVHTQTPLAAPAAKSTDCLFSHLKANFQVADICGWLNDPQDGLGPGA